MRYAKIEGEIWSVGNEGNQTQHIWRDEVSFGWQCELLFKKIVFTNIKYIRLIYSQFGKVQIF